MDFDDAWDAYHIHLIVTAGCTDGTDKEYSSTLHRWDRFLQRQGVAWDAASRQDLDAFLALPVQIGRRRGQPLSVNRRRTLIATIRSFYRYAALAGILEGDPFSLVRLPRRRKATPRSFLLPQLAMILRAARDDPRLYLLCRLGFDAGLRRAEIAGLDLADFAREPWPGDLRVVGKGEHERWVPLTAPARRAIDRYLGVRAMLTAGPLVQSRRHPGRGLNPQTVGELLAEHIHACGFEQGSAHWLRHSFAYLALEAAEGSNLEDLREAMGHASSNTTRRYGDRFQWNVKRNVIDVLPDPELSPSSAISPTRPAGR